MTSPSANQQKVPQPVHGLIVGLGSIGQRHLRNLRSLVPQAEITVLRRPGSQARPAEEQLASRTVHQLSDALAHRPQFAIVATPTACHLETAIRLADAGVDLLIEKPLSHRLEGVDRLLELVAQRGVMLSVGYNLRFEPSLAAMREAMLQGSIGKVLSLRAEVGQYLPDWRPGGDYRLAVSARAELGGGALLELSHEIDYVRWLLGEPSQVRAHVLCSGELEIDVEDLAELSLEFSSGAVGSIHLDMLQRPAVRSCRVIGTRGILHWCGQTFQAKCYTRASGRWRELSESSQPNRNAMYLTQLQHFLDCVSGWDTPCVTGEDGKRVLRIIEAARISAQRRQAVEI